MFTAALFTATRTWKQPKCQSTYDSVVHIYNGLLLSHKKEHIWVSANEVDEPRAYYTEWSKKEKDKYCILTHIYRIQKDGTKEFIFRAMEKRT